ncbi:TetR/AcrR family transcriptional regulator [Sneathiella marina]|uniref:TetR/AcrR family transcriptional regulator n=1 Tax=Sneathiella marina TaxID=2950108 RepID=A0ABY4W1S8_9PROT|nr:TetR/AcrR family transcriptional regulator [Sneathiella marina]USG61116.1 TetR/AcrR family transcriptional regulator [Sneathiella marina]
MNTRKKAKEERRALIVEAAVICFIRKGIHQTGIRDIAEQANVSLGNLYNHFPGKDALIAEIARLDGMDLEQFATELDISEDPGTAIARFVDGYLDYVSSTENAVLTIDITAEAIRNPAIAKQFDVNRQRLMDVLSATIIRGNSQGIMRSGLHIEESVDLILDAIEGLGMRAGLTGRKPSKKARKTLHDMIFRMLSPSRDG